MKKKTLSIVALLALFALSACDTKMCYCYEVTSSEQVYESQAYVNSDKHCNSLNNSSRTCVESNERMNPNDIGVSPGMKGK